MIKILAAALILSGIAATANAQGAFETREQHRQRNSAQNWNTQQRTGTPLGGYNQPLGSSPQFGTERPGYNSPSSGGFNSGTNNNSGFNSNPYGGNQRR